MSNTNKATNDMKSALLIRDFSLGILLIATGFLFFSTTKELQMLSLTITHGIVFFSIIHLSSTIREANWILQTGIPAILLALQFTMVIIATIYGGSIQDTMIFSLSVGSGCALILHHTIYSRYHDCSS